MTILINRLESTFKYSFSQSPTPGAGHSNAVKRLYAYTYVRHTGYGPTGQPELARVELREGQFKKLARKHRIANRNRRPRPLHNAYSLSF